MRIHQHHSQDNCRKIYNYLKQYPTYVKLTVYKYPIHVPIQTSNNSTISSTNSTQSHESKEKSLLRAKTTITDLTICNEFDLFTTFTFKDDRQDIDKCRKKMSCWLNSQQKQYGSFKYLIVAELHKDKQSLHFHALMKGYKGKLTPKMKRDGKPLLSRGKNQLYKIKSWESGFSDASYIKPENYGKVANYVRKYITKDMPYFSGKKRFWSSNGLLRPVTDYNIEPKEFYLNPDTEVYQYQDTEVRIIRDSLALAQSINHIPDKIFL